MTVFQRLLSLILVAAFAAATHSASAQASGEQSQDSASKPKIQWRTHKEVESMPLDSYVFVRARVISIKPPDEGSRQPWSLYTQDDTGSMRVIIWSTIWDQIPNNDAVQRGLIIDLYGRVSEFRGARQVEIEQPNWIRAAPVEQKYIENRMAKGGFGITDDYIQVTIGGVTMSAIGQKVLLRGEVTEFQQSTMPRVPSRIYLRDETGTVQVVWWEDVGADLRPQQAPQVGKPLEIRGEVSEYAGDIQVKVLNKSHVRRPDLESAAPAPGSMQAGDQEANAGE